MWTLLACMVCYLLGLLTAAVLCHLRDIGVRENKGRPGLIQRMGVMNLILVLCGIALVIFTAICLWMFTKYMEVPNTLITCVFAALTGEAGVMGWIKTNKDKTQSRKWELEDKITTIEESKPAG